MGVVYEALDRETNARVALKTLRYVDANTLYLLKNEFRALQDLSHPNLVNLGELIEAEGQWFLTMELLDGVDFVSYVRPPSGAGRGYDDRKLRAGLGQLAQGLMALHGARMVHRDIKPSNVLVTNDGRVVLLDFGLITEAKDPQQSAEVNVVGTATYMSPEQAASKPVGPEADWYAAGVVLYEALTGSVPFSGTPFEIMLDKQRHAPPPPRARVPELPADLDQLCVDLLAFEPSARPSGTQVLKRLGVDVQSLPGATATSSQFTHSSPFVGREHELKLLRRAHDDTLAGAPVTVMVHGESGIGKSALIRHFTEALAGEIDDLIVLRGRCFEREAVPYKAFDGVIDELAKYLRRLSREEVGVLLPRYAALLRRVFPVLGRVEAIAQAPRLRRDVEDPHELRARVFSALGELFLRLCDTHPTVVVIDDLQWADADSLWLLADLIRPPDAPPLLLLVSSRLETIVDADGRSMIPADTRRIELEALGIDAARKLARLLLRQAKAGDATSSGSIAVEARGHPLYIDELVRHVALEGEQRSSLRLDDAIWSRVSKLSQATRHVLELVAIAGAPLRQAIIASAAQMDAADFTKQVSVLRVANLVRGSDRRDSDHIEPYHDRVREGVLEHLDEPTRVARHARLAIALESAGAATERPELLVRHLVAAGEGSKAAAYAEEGARRASDALAFDRAADLYRTALDLGDNKGEALRALRISLGEALAKAGRGEEAAGVFLQAADGADPATRHECHRQAAEQLLTTGHIERGLETLAALLAEVGVSLPSTPRRALMSAVWQRVKLRVRGLRWKPRHEREIADSDLARLDACRVASESLAIVDNIRGADFQGRSFLMALRLGESVRIARSLAMEAMYCGALGGRGLGRARMLMGRLREIAAKGENPSIDALDMSISSALSFCEGHFHDAAAGLEQAEAQLRGLPAGFSLELTNVRVFRLFVLRMTGDWTQQQLLLNRYLSDAARRGDRYAETTMRRASNFLWLVHDQPEEARRDLELTTWTPPEGGYHLQHWYELEARAHIALYEGNAARALEELRPAFAALRKSMLLRIQHIRSAEPYYIGRLSLAAATREGADDRKFLLEQATRMARRLEREGIGFASTYGRLLRAGIAVQQQGAENAIPILRDAVATADAAEMAPWAMGVRLRLGEIVGGDEGAALVAEVAEWGRKAGVVNLDRAAEILAPGLRPPAS